MEVHTTLNAQLAVGLNINDEEVIGYDVDGLDDTYRSFLTHLQFNPATSFDELVCHLLQEENLLKCSESSLAPPVAFATQ